MGQMRGPSRHRPTAGNQSADVQPQQVEVVSSKSTKCPIDSTVFFTRALEMWKVRRYSGEAINSDERSALEALFFSSVPTDKAKFVSACRLDHPSLLRKFCAEELQSLKREEKNQRKHKEFMFLHGTRWDCISPIRSEGLDPECGHLSKGVWLG